MAKDPAFLFYYQDFAYGTRKLTFEEKGAYIELLCEQADSGHLSINDIKRILKNSFHIWDAICEKFITDDKGCFYNEVLELHLLKRRNFTESRKNNLKGKHKATHMDTHMEDVNENTNEDLNVLVLNEDRFLDFWNLYDKKVRKPAAQKQWVKLTEAEKQKVLDITPAYVKSKPEKQYRLDPERFLKYKSFNDEIIEAKNGTNKNNGGASPEFLRELVTKRAEKERG